MKNQSKIIFFVLSLVMLLFFTNCENNEIQLEEKEVGTEFSEPKSNLRAVSGLSVTLKSRMEKPGGRFVIYFSGGSPNEKVNIEDPIMRRSTSIKLNASGIGTYICKVENWIKPGFFAFKINNTYSSVAVLASTKYYETRRNIYLGNAVKINDFKYPASYILYKPKATSQQVKEAGKEILREAFLAYTDSKHKRFVLSVTASACLVTNIAYPGSTAKACKEWLKVEAKSFAKEVAKQTFLYSLKKNTALNEKTKTSIRLLLENTETALAIAEFNKDGEITELVEDIDSILSSGNALTFELVNSGFFTATYQKNGKTICLGVCKK